MKAQNEAAAKKAGREIRNELFKADRKNLEKQFNQRNARIKGITYGFFFVGDFATKLWQKSFDDRQGLEGKAQAGVKVVAMQRGKSSIKLKLGKKKTVRERPFLKSVIRVPSSPII